MGERNIETVGGLERRYIDLAEAGIEVRKDEDGKMILRGRPVVYGKYTRIYDFLEIIQEGAAGDLLNREEMLLWQHDMSRPMAAVKNGTLKATESKAGIDIEADVSGTVWGRDGFEAVKSGVVDKMSFGFIPLKVRWEEKEIDGKMMDVRVIEAFKRLVDYSPVSFPAYNDTSISARSMADTARENTPKEERETSETESSTEPTGPSAEEIRKERELWKAKTNLAQMEGEITYGF